MGFKERLDLLKSHLSPQLVLFVFAVVFVGMSFDSLVSSGLLAAFDAAPFDLALGLLVDFVFAAVLTAAIVVGVGTTVVVRLTGPLEKSHDLFKELANGDLTNKLTLEKGQLLETYCEDVNYALANLREFVAEDRFRLQHAAELLRSLARNHPEAYEEVEEVIRGTLAKITVKLTLEEGDAGPDLSSDATGVYRGLVKR